MSIDSGALDKRITIERAAAVDDGFSETEGEFAVFIKVWAKKTDASDGERVRAAEQGAEITSRFLIRSTERSRTITPKDRLVYHGRAGDRPYNITGVKEVGDDGLELTATARLDQGDA